MTGALRSVRLAFACLPALVLSGCAGSDPGPLQVGGPLESGQIVKPGTTIGWGLVQVWSPDDRSFTVTAARALTSDAEASAHPAYGMAWPRGIGAVQFTPWPPADPELGGDEGGPRRLTDVARGSTQPPAQRRRHPARGVGVGRPGPSG